MKIIHSASRITPAFPLEISVLLDTDASLDKILFFDIETTGFSPDSAQIYLIGCLYCKLSSAAATLPSYEKRSSVETLPSGEASSAAETPSWQMIQWFGEKPEDEVLLLGSFFAFLKPCKALIHYNGDAFDLSFIRSRCRLYHLDCPLSEVQSIDLYRKIRPWKGALSMPALKQKAVETFLSIRREEDFTGRQLIAAYQDYCSSPRNALLNLLLLHNQEDLCGLAQILPLLIYTKLPGLSFSLTGHGIEETEKIREGNGSSLKLYYQSPVLFPVPFYLEGPFFVIEGNDKQILVALPVYCGEMKYFYPEVQNYYYLPFEDMAVHKSVGNYVARDARKKATPKTCYTRKTGQFFPQPENLYLPAFQHAYKSRPCYAEYSAECFSDLSAADTFIRQLFLTLPVFS